MLAILGRAHGRGDRGALTLSYVVIVPVFLLVVMAIAQTSLWYLARQAALAAARQGADAARAQHAPLDAGPPASRHPVTCSPRPRPPLAAARRPLR